MSLGEKIREQRKKAGLSQEQLAEKREYIDGTKTTKRRNKKVRWRHQSTDNIRNMVLPCRVTVYNSGL